MIVFESEMYALNGSGCLPFKIVVEETREGDKRRVEVKRMEYIPVGNKMIEKENFMCTSVWTEK